MDKRIPSRRLLYAAVGVLDILVARGAIFWVDCCQKNLDFWASFLPFDVDNLSK